MRDEIDLDAAPADEADREVEHGQRLQAEEVELDQPRLLDPFHVELGDLHARARVAVERHQPVERPVADDDAGGMGRGVAVEALELLRDVEQPRDHRLASSRAACKRGSSAIAFSSVTGLAGFCGTILASRSTWP